MTELKQKRASQAEGGRAAEGTESKNLARKDQAGLQRDLKSSERGKEHTSHGDCSLQMRGSCSEVAISQKNMAELT